MSIQYLVNFNDLELWNNAPPVQHNPHPHHHHHGNHHHHHGDKKMSPNLAVTASTSSTSTQQQQTQQKQPDGDWAHFSPQAEDQADGEMQQQQLEDGVSGHAKSSHIEIPRR